MFFMVEGSLITAEVTSVKHVPLPHPCREKTTTCKLVTPPQVSAARTGTEADRHTGTTVRQTSNLCRKLCIPGRRRRRHVPNPVDETRPGPLVLTLDRPADRQDVSCLTLTVASRPVTTLHGSQ